MDSRKRKREVSSGGSGEKEQENKRERKEEEDGKGGGDAEEKNPLKVFILHGGDLKVEEEITVTKLPHPSTGESVRFLVRDGKLLELQRMEPHEGLGMWFVDETISSDGFLYVGTPFDPLFLVLRFFHLKGENLFKNLDDLLFENAMEETREGIKHLRNCLKDSSVEMICEVKKVGSDSFFRLNNSLVSNWLCGKASSICMELLQHQDDLSARSSSIVASSETSSSSTDPTDRQFVAKSVAMLGEYLTEHHLSLLKETLGVSEDDTFEKMSDEQKKALENAYDPRALMCARRGKKSDGEDSLTTPPTSTKEKTQKVHEKKQKETKEKLNLKSITSFFTPKR